MTRGAYRALTKFIVSRAPVNRVMSDSDTVIDIAIPFREMTGAYHLLSPALPDERVRYMRCDGST